MRHFRTFPSPGITAEDSPVSRTRCLAHETSLADLFVSRTRRLAHETTLADSFVSRTRRLAHETSSEGHSVSRTRRLAHETTLADSFVSRTRRLAHETTSADHPVSRMRRLAHENDSEDPPVSRMRRLAHETTSEDPPVSRMRLFAHETTLEDTDKPFLYQSYLLATLVHQTSLSCTNPISWPLWYTRQASPVPIISPGDFGTESLLLIQHRKEMAAESLLLATISYSEIRNYLVIFMLPTLSPHSPSCTIGTGTPSRLFS